MKLHSLIRKLARILGIERLYAWILEREVREGNIPEHVAVIMDGNRRWASERGLPRHEGYYYGANKVEELLKWSRDLGIKTLTLYALSLENLRRPKEELEAIFRVMEEKADMLIDKGILEEEGIRFKVIGDTSPLPKSLREKLKALEDSTKNCSSGFLNLAISYSGRREIVEAVKRIATLVKEGKISPEEVNEKVIEENLFTSHLKKSDPDLIIRTSGEFRISGFLLWQSAYSEFVFMDVYWPDFRRIDFLRAIRTYQKRNRRFGL